MKASITARFTLAVVLIHAILLPALYVGLSLVVERSHGDLFVQKVRTFSRNLAEEMEVGDALDSRSRVNDLLDLAIMNGEAVYAELKDNDKSISSNLNNNTVRWPGRQDFGFGVNDDQTYFIQLSLARPGHSAELRLGFDESPTHDQVRLAKRRILWVLTGYVSFALALSALFARRLSQPIVGLAAAARRIASGNYVQTLDVQSGVRELHQLGQDLEDMRHELVGINERLRAEIGQKERAQTERQELERRLHHRQRVETVGTLAGGIAHEINNALLPIMLLTELVLADLPADSAARTDLEGVLSSARRAKEIVVKVLTFSRETGAAELKPIDLESVVGEALRLFGVMVASGVDVRVEIDGPYPPVNADRSLTVQMIVNLCTNAYQAMSGNPGILTVGLSNEQPAGRGSPGDCVALTISDTGHGMSPETMERIFEPFFTTRSVGNGTGLGLAVVHGIAESFGAVITVESELGRGSTFKVYFPVARQGIASAAQVAAGVN